MRRLQQPPLLCASCASEWGARRHACWSSPASVSADIDALAWQPTVRCGLEFDFLDVVVAADGTPYASLGDGCTAEERHSRPGQGIVGHLVSGPPLVGTAGEQRPLVTLPRRCRRPLRNPAAAATAWSVGQRPDLRQRPEGAYGARPPAARANPARPPSARPGRGHDRCPDEHRADGGAHAPLSDVRALSTERRVLSQAAPLSRLRGH